MKSHDVAYMHTTTHDVAYMHITIPTTQIALSKLSQDRLAERVPSILISDARFHIQK